MDLNRNIWYFKTLRLLWKNMSFFEPNFHSKRKSYTRNELSKCLVFLLLLVVPYEHHLSFSKTIKFCLVPEGEYFWKEQLHLSLFFNIFHLFSQFILKYPDLNNTTYPNLSKTVFVIFMIFVPILLLNMLIAMMGNTYAQVIERSEKEWMKQVKF